MIVYDQAKKKWVEDSEPSRWAECLCGAILFILTLAALFGGML